MLKISTKTTVDFGSGARGRTDKPTKIGVVSMPTPRTQHSSHAIERIEVSKTSPAPLEAIE